MTQTDIHIRISGFIYKPLNKKLFEKAVDVVSSFTGTPQNRILCKSRKRQLVIARCMVISLCKGAQKNISDTELGFYISRDRTSVIHIRQVFFDFFDTDSSFCQQWEDMRMMFSKLLNTPVILPERPARKKKSFIKENVIQMNLIKSIAK